ncbi:hypothetical protein Y032_0283g1322 [Ancylostoma ceylanicum]|uniref:Uncharacterized protein n=1 Tax=Ancylostoma ceylanicum TaxID=53326 RepID=A0A016S6C1_9BILA|nr:hypothetical protein Y032_0283g1322 [Ancylostoma ceylanicum]
MLNQGQGFDLRQRHNFCKTIFCTSPHTSAQICTYINPLGSRTTWAKRSVSVLAANHNCNVVQRVLDVSDR